MASGSPLLLNVDDYAPARYAKTKILRQAGFDVLEAATGKAALEIAAERRPYLIMLDVNLPDINGLEVCRRIKANIDTASITVVQTSASHIQSQSQVQGLDNGADAYLTEPIEPSLLVATIRALLRARQAEDSLRRSNEELKQLSYMLSHELNEPLRMVTSYVQLLARRYRGRLDQDADEYIGYAVEGVQRMQQFIQDILRYTRTANIVTERQKVQGEAVLRYALQNLKGAVEESGAKITHDPLPELLGDEMGLAHLLQNLVGNAIKYRKPDVTPKIHIGVGDRASHWRFCVQDNGVGMDPKYYDRVFGMFQRLHGKEVSGSGIGLALCKRIVETHGGQIWVESTPGEGSTFFFTILK